MTKLPPLSARAELALELQNRRQARKSFAGFVDYVRPDYIWSDFARSVCAELDAFIRDMAAGKRPILILGAPPQHGKSELVSRLLPAYIFGLNPNIRIGGLSYGASLAIDMNRDVQRVMMGDRYHRLFPATRLNDRRVVTVESDAKRNSDEFEIVGHRGSYVCAGVGGALTGKSLDLGIIDDPIKNAQEARSKLVKDGVWSWYTSTFLTRLSKNSGQIIMATRWALDDLSGRIIEKYPRARVVNFPAIDADGNALVPELHPLAKLLEMKQTMTEYFWSAMYQQNPIPDGGGDFQPEEIVIVDALPSGLQFVRGWDLASSIKKQADYTATVKIGIKEGIVYIAHAKRFRGRPDEVAKTIRLLADTDEATRTSIPQDPGQAGKAQVASLSKLLQGKRVTFSPETGDKRTRAEPIAAQVNAGNVRMLRGAWNADLLEELAAFPNVEHDDQVDALSRAYNEATASSYSLKGL